MRWASSGGLSFFSWVNGFLVIDLYEFFTVWTGDPYPIYDLQKLSPIPRFNQFHFLDCFLEAQTILIFIKSKLSNFSFVTVFSGSCLRKHSLTHGHKDQFVSFLLGEFYHRSHLEVLDTFSDCLRCEREIRLHPLARGHPPVTTPFREDSPFPHWIFLTPLLKIN